MAHPLNREHLKNRKMNKPASLRAYELRMHTLTDEAMLALDNKWIASFEMYDTYTINDPEIDRRYESFLDNSCFRLAQVCKARGVNIKGVTSTRIIKGIRIAAIKADELSEIVYVGPHISFQNFRSSIFSLRVEDKCFEKNVLQDQR